MRGIFTTSQETPSDPLNWMKAESNIFLLSSKGVIEELVISLTRVSIRLSSTMNSPIR